MNFITMFDNFIFYPVRELVSMLLNSDVIKREVFSNQVTLFTVICTFIIGAMLIRFLLRPIRLNLESPTRVSVEVVDRQTARDNYYSESGYRRY